MINWFYDKFGILKAWIVHNGKLVLVTLVTVLTATALVNLPNGEVPYIDFNGELIAFPYTDDNSGENVLIRNDREFYGAFNEDEYITFYTLVGNNSGVGQNMNIYPTFADYVKDIQVSRLYQDIPHNIEVPIYEKSCEIINSTTTDSSEEICKNVLTGTETQVAYGDEWRTESLLTFNDFEINVNLSKGNYERKLIPFKYKAELKSIAYIESDEIAYFKTRFRGVPPRITDEFFIEVVGDKGAYGHQDPTISSAWAGFDTVTPSSTLVASDETNITLLDNCVNDSSDFKTNIQTDGDDVRYTTSTELGSTVLSHEIVSYADGDCEIWVKVPNITSSTDTSIYKWAGNAGAADISTSTAWSDFHGVWHLGNSTTTDSSPNNASDGREVGSPATTTGMFGIGSAYNFSGLNDVYASTTMAVDLDAGNFTQSVWMQVDADESGRVFNWGENSGAYGLAVGSGTDSSEGKEVLVVYDAVAWMDSNTTISENTWNLLTIVDSGSDTQIIYLNGDQIGTFSVVTPASLCNVTFGASANCQGSVVSEFDGFVDEARMYNGQLSTGWITTEYNNITASSTFWVNTGFTEVVARRTMLVK